MPASKPYRDFMIYFSNEKKNLRNLTVIDTSANGANVNIKLINQSGELAYDLNITLTPGSGTLVNLSGYIDEINNGVIRIISSSEIIADYWESDLDSGSLILDTGINYRNKQFLCSTYFSLYKNMNFELFLLNIGKEISKVEIQFYNSNGERIGTKKITLGTYRDFSQLLDHYFKGVILGTLIIKESTSELLATTIITDANNRLLGKAAVY